MQFRLSKLIYNVSNAVGRFPLTAVFLLIAVVLNGMMIHDREFSFEKHLMTIAVGVLLSALFQMIYERFYSKRTTRFSFMGLTVLLMAGYYFTIMNQFDLRMEAEIKTFVLLFGLFIGFLWVPSIKNKTTFNEVFMVSFKSFFIALLFSVVLMAGFSLVFLAIDELLFDVNSDIYAHASNVIFILFAVMYFLSLIPIYPGAREGMDEGATKSTSLDNLAKATSCPKYLEILISYIVIPISVIFTLILLAYIVINVSGSFWNDALLEPMLVSYIVVVILLYILSSRMHNKSTVLFRKYFPKILIPIVIFQTLNSFLRIGDFGLTYGRYYVILFGIFAFIASLVFSLKPVEKNGIVPMVLIICIAISLIPMLDAFSVSKTSQIKVLESTLVENEMLRDGEVKPKPEIQENGREKIVETMQYLNRMEYLNELAWLPEDFEYYKDFSDVFGFSPYEYPRSDVEYFHFRSENNRMIDIAGYDYFAQTHISNYDGAKNADKNILVTEDDRYQVVHEVDENDSRIVLRDIDGNEIASLADQAILKHFENYIENDYTLSLEEASVVSENEQATFKLVVFYIDIDKSEEHTQFNAEIYLLVDLN